MHLTKSQLDTILVRQKNALLRKINLSIAAKSVQSLHDCETLLFFVQELWIATNYGYKFHELLKRIDSGFHELDY